MNLLDQIRQQGHDIESRAVDLDILLETILEQIDAGGVDRANTLTAINCFTTCALRNVALIKEHNLHILALTGKGAGNESVTVGSSFVELIPPDAGRVSSAVSEYPCYCC